MFDPLVPLTHDVLLSILPFGCGYMCDTEGDPCMESLKITLILNAMMVMFNPYAAKRVEIN